MVVVVVVHFNPLLSLKGTVETIFAASSVMEQTLLHFAKQYVVNL